MKSYAVQVHLYGSVAVVTLCSTAASRVDGGTCLEHLVQVLDGIEDCAGSVVLDLDRAPRPALVEALAVVDAWAAERGITVVALASGHRRTGTRRPSAPALRAAPVGFAEGVVLGPSDDAAAPVRQLRGGIGVRALVHQAAGIRQARHHAHPCC